MADGNILVRVNRNLITKASASLGADLEGSRTRLMDAWTELHERKAALDGDCSAGAKEVRNRLTDTMMCIDAKVTRCDHLLRALEI